MSKPKRYDYEEIQVLVERAHQRATGAAMGDVRINLLVKHNTRLLTELLSKDLKAYGLSHSGYVALMVLYTTPDNRANPSDLCVCSGETRANMTRICDELVEQGFVRRITNPDDRRRVDLSLTDTGADILKTVVPVLRERAHAVFSVFDTQEKVVFEAQLLKLMRSLESHC